MWPRRKRWSLMGGVSPVEGTINQPDPNARFRQNPFQQELTDPNWSGVPRASSPQYDYTMDASAGSPAKKKSNKLKYIVEALKEMEGAEPPKLSGGKFGRAMPAPLGFSLASMGGRLGEQEAMAKARREEELRRGMKLMGGGY